MKLYSFYFESLILADVRKNKDKRLDKLKEHKHTYSRTFLFQVVPNFINKNQ